ncbi:S8 family peptidase [Paenibacillus kobensis]|uniref:S8 family peptidase n=1 Tax=Paenibacillus kobensis TaxID=59841 RepID=UPI001FE61BD5|nr:S8 family serine peptidase [Paenibacillus kobensis]
MRRILRVENDSVRREASGLSWRWFPLLLIASLIVMITPVTAGSYNGLSEEDHYYTLIKKNDIPYDRFVAKVKQEGFQVVYEVRELGLIQVKGKAGYSGRLAADSQVESFNRSVRALEPAQDERTVSLATLPYLWDLQWDMQQSTRNGSSYNVYEGSSKVIVGIIDSGLYPHPDLAANIKPGSRNLVPAGGFRGGEPQESGNVNQTNDLTGHGTFVAGQVAADGMIKGIAPHIGIRSYRVFGSGSAETIWVIKAIVEAAKDDVDVINLSLGSYLIKGLTFSSEGKSNEELVEIEGYKRAIEYARDRGSVVVAAVGNDGVNEKDRKQFEQFMRAKMAEDGVTFKGKVFDVPASLPNVVTVASVGPTNELSLFSNYGRGLVDISAPGGDYRYYEQYGIDRWLAEGWYEKEQVISTVVGGGYGFMAGTSVATPKVSAALGLIIGKYGLKNKPAQAERHLYKYGVDSSGKDSSFYGSGILNVYKAVTR